MNRDLKERPLYRSCLTHFTALRDDRSFDALRQGMIRWVPGSKAPMPKKLVVAKTKIDNASASVVQESNRVVFEDTYWKETLERRLESLGMNMFIMLLVIVDVVNVMISILDEQSVAAEKDTTSIISLSILSIFSAELMLRWIAMGRRFWYTCTRTCTRPYILA